MEFIDRHCRTLTIVVLALSVVGAVLVLSTPYGGMTVATYYGLRERHASLASEYSELTDNLFIVLSAISMLATALLSFVVRRSVQLKEMKPIRMAWFFSVLTLALSIAGGVTYQIVRAAIGYEDWWLDTGFFAVMVVGLLSSSVYTLILRRAKQAWKPGREPPG